MPSILFVCTANQIRSPMAAAMFRAALSAHPERRSQNGVEGQEWRVESAGTWVKEGLPANRAAQQVMRELGLDLSHHRTRCVTGELLRQFDLILVMERNHKEALRVEFPALRGRIRLCSELAGGEWDVPDCAEGGEDEVREAAKMIAGVLERGRERIADLRF